MKNIFVVPAVCFVLIVWWLSIQAFGKMFLYTSYTNLPTSKKDSQTQLLSQQKLAVLNENMEWHQKVMHMKNYLTVKVLTQTICHVVYLSGNAVN